MTVEALLNRLDGVRRSGRGWMSKCPGHSDRSPSLSIREAENGDILIHDFAGCSTQDIVKSLGLSMSHLFHDAPSNLRQRALPPQPPRPFNWRHESSDLLHRAEELELRRNYVRAHTRGLDCTDWTDQDINAALAVVAQANCDELIAELFRDVAFNVRAICLAQEEKEYANRTQHRRAAAKSCVDAPRESDGTHRKKH